MRLFLSVPASPPRFHEAMLNLAFRTTNRDALVMYDAIDHQNGKGTMSFEKEGGPPIPRRVLDIGCGMAAHWCLHMVQAKGWESTQFVGATSFPFSTRYRFETDTACMHRT